MASNGYELSSDQRVLETIFNPEHPIVGKLIIFLAGRYDFCLLIHKFMFEKKKQTRPVWCL